MTAGMRDVPLGELAFMNTSEVASLSGDAVAVSAPQELAELVRLTDQSERRFLMVAGELSNTIVSEKFEGRLVIFRGGSLGDFEVRSGGDVLMEVEASCSLDAAVQASCSEGLAGIELLSGIPGTIGAAVAQNVAAYGQSISDVFVTAEALDMSTGEEVRLGPTELAFAYRRSSLKASGGFSPPLVILAVHLLLSRHAPEPLRYADLARWHRDRGRSEADLGARRQSVLELRSTKGMVVGGEGWVPCSGSFFVGPSVPPDSAKEIAESVRGPEFAERFLEWYRPDVAAVRLPAAIVLRAAGFMNGDRWGPVGLGARHILALCNLGGACGDQIVTVGAHIAGEVRRRLGIELIPEVRVLGEPVIAGWDEFSARYPFSPGSGEPEWAVSMGGRHVGTN